jgi:3-isopropylmalate dehydrogenase
MKIAVLAGDGIGPEVTREAVRVIEALGLPGLELTYADVGGAAYKAHGHPLPPETLAVARAADAILFGAVGDPDCDNLERALRPEQAIWACARNWGSSPTCVLPRFSRGWRIHLRCALKWLARLIC